MMLLHILMQNADRMWLESSCLRRFSATSRGLRHNRDTLITLPRDRIRVPCLWGSEAAFVRLPPILYLTTPGSRELGVVVFAKHLL